MLPKKNRITSKYEFNKVRNLANKNGTKYTAKWFQVFWLDVDDYDGPPKVGIVVSNKVNKSAVKRNKIKRIFREVVKEHFDKIKHGYWVVIHPKASSIEGNYDEISTDFNRTIQEISISK
jgi:ribonuclease P protein component